MTYEEKIALDWLVKTFKLDREDIKKNPRSPDFTCAVGGFEVKSLSSQNTITFTTLQLRDLDGVSDLTVLVFKGDELITQIPGELIKKRLESFGGVTIHYDAHDVPVTARISIAADRELESICRETGRKKSELIREAVIAFIGMYRHAGKA